MKLDAHVWDLLECRPFVYQAPPALQCWRPSSLARVLAHKDPDVCASVPQLAQLWTTLSTRNERARRPWRREGHALKNVSIGSRFQTQSETNS